MSTHPLRDDVAQGRPDRMLTRIALGGAFVVALLGGLSTDSLLIGLAVLALPFLALTKRDTRREVVGGLAVLWALIGWTFGKGLVGAEAGLVTAALAGALGYQANAALGHKLDALAENGPLWAQAQQALAGWDIAATLRQLRAPRAQGGARSPADWTGFERGVVKFAASVCLMCGIGIVTMVGYHMLHETSPKGPLVQVKSPSAPLAAHRAGREVSTLSATRPASGFSGGLSRDLDKYEIVACVEAALRGPAVAQMPSREELALACALMLSQ